MKNHPRGRLAAGLATLVLALPAASQEAFEGEIYDPSPVHPFGRPNPAAAPELAQFAFMVGECDCVDEIRQPDGSWASTPAVWNARYFLNGHGIQDVYWSDTFATTNIRIFDPHRSRWFVQFHRSPNGAVGRGEWVGREEGQGAGRSMVMWSGAPDGRNGSRLTFFDITDEGFEWHAEGLKNGVASESWRSSCRRRKPGGTPREPAFSGHDATPAHPFGRRHPGAPKELEQFAFLVGGFEAETTLYAASGEAREIRSLSRGHWMLNGWAIQDHVYGAEGFRSSIRQWDRAAGRWRVSTFRMPDYSWTVWDGGVQGEELVLREVPAPGTAQGEVRWQRFHAEDGGYFVLAETEQEGRTIAVREDRFKPGR